jgi:serine/threonine-protein kinase RsbW
VREPTARQALAAPSACRSRSFPAVPSQVPQARRFLASLLDSSPATDDALICLSELTTNAIQHSHSGRPDGTFTLRITLTPGRARIEVHDQGGPWTPGRDGDGQSGRGLLVVGELATAWGISGDGVSARVVWFEIGCP